VERTTRPLGAVLRASGAGGGAGAPSHDGAGFYTVPEKSNHDSGRPYSDRRSSHTTTAPLKCVRWRTIARDGGVGVDHDETLQCRLTERFEEEAPGPEIRCRKRVADHDEGLAFAKRFERRIPHRRERMLAKVLVEKRRNDEGFHLPARLARPDPARRFTHPVRRVSLQHDPLGGSSTSFSEGYMRSSV